MNVEFLAISDVVLIRPKRFLDERGWFMETYNEPEYIAGGVRAKFVQDNQSLSHPRFTVRGLHFQLPPHSQAKLVRVTRGAVFDVAVDLRVGSRTYGRWCGAELTEVGEQLFLPAGFAHGFCTLQANTEVCYKVSDYYAPECDAGLRWDDPDLAIKWPLDGEAPILSEKDRNLPAFADFVSPF